MQQYVFIVIIAIVFLAMIIFAVIGKNYSLDKIKARKVGNGQHGTAHWAEHKEISQNFSILKYEPQLWRMGACRPTIDGTIVGFEKKGKDTYALIDTSDVHTLMIAAAGTGKTTFFLEPNIEYCCAAGMSFISTDTKGDIYRNCGYVAAKRYGYKISVIDLRNPLKSDGFNLLHLVKKYMDEHKNNPLNISAKAKSERYAKIVADSIIAADGDKYGANTYFYDAAKGLIAALILIIAEYGNDKECHIVSVLKLMIELLEAKPQKKSQLKSETYFGAESKYFNGHTNIKDGKMINFLIRGIMDTNAKLRDTILFNLLSYIQNRLLTKGRTFAGVDELHLFLNNLTTVKYLRAIMKQDRKMDSGLIIASQNVEDLTLPGIKEYTKPLLSIPTHQFFFYPGIVSSENFIDTLQLDPAEYKLINKPSRSHCLYRCGNERYLLKVIAPPYKAALFGTGGGR